ncbi:hypothetical protein J437_LFUL002003 [Ladona fulva]|uniref:Serpin domain-containing protein n=1 Tax=Ladona fulva TaxID=123851 RepID=A0A8K0NSH8_LADFU|nr:hypothetical protein J437_LFUL002003 [Ladona fulva]
MMEGTYASLLTVMVFLPVGLVCLPQLEFRGNLDPAIQFPGHDAFDAISGLKNSSSAFPSPARPVPSTTTPPPFANGFAPNPATTERQRAPTFESAECRDVYHWDNISPFDQERALTEGDTRLSIESMFRIINKMEAVILDKNENIVFSPIGFTSVLGQLMLAAQGNTLQELENLLAPGKSSCPDGAANKFHNSFKSLVIQLARRRRSGPYELSLRNALFHQYPGPLLRKQFTDLLSSNYATEVRKTDFRQSPEIAQRFMNEWGSSASRGKITQLIPQPPPRTTSAIMASMTYFKASWENLFSSRFTSPGPFYLDGHRNGRVKTVDFMVAEFEVPYAESTALGCRILALPYVNNETVLYVVMPLGPPKRRRPSPSVQSVTPAPVLPSSSPSSGDDILVSRVGETEPVDNQNTFGNRVNPSKSPSIIHRLHTFYTTDSVLYPGRPHAVMYAFIQSSLQQVQRQKRQLQPCSSGNVPCLEDRQGDKQEESPYSAANLHRVAARLGPSEFARLASEMRVRKVSVILPKLSMSTNIKLKDTLHALGVQSLFGDGANLSGAVDEGAARGGLARQEAGWWKVDEVWQQSKLDVDEYGTEAASGTAVSIIDYGGDSVVFKANSPFLAVIRHEATGAPIFWASVVNPS